VDACHKRLATLALLAIMMLQVSGGLNNCVCRSSIFGGLAYGGYMILEDGPYLNEPATSCCFELSYVGSAS